MTAAYAEGVLQEWWARGYSWASSVETKSTHLRKHDNDPPIRRLGVLSVSRAGTVRVERRDTDGY